MTTTGHNLLQAILADPGDDALRLVYADWLEEQGDDRDRWRATMMRGTWWKGGPARYHSTFPEFAFLYGERSKSPHVTIDGEPYFGEPTTAATVTIRRGFAEELDCTCQQWLAHGPALVRAHPLVRVGLTDKDCRWVPDATGGDQVFNWLRVGSLTDGTYHPEILAPVAYQDRVQLPDILWHEVLKTSICPDNTHWAGFTTNEDAINALSSACLAWARATEPV